MREIIFRAWAFGELHYLKENDYVQLFNDGSGSLWTGWDEEKKENTHCIGVESGCFMQFTGLKDKNGKDIYEGDIIESPFFENYYVPVIWNKMFCQFTFGAAEFNVEVKPESIIVVGNIYETPHLMISEQSPERIVETDAKSRL